MTIVRSIIGQEFAYASGRSAVLRQVLLDGSDVDRMLGAHDKKDFEKMLTELKLTMYIDQSLDKGEIILDALSGWTRKEVEHMSPESKASVFNILWLAGDSPILSYYIKKHHKLTSIVSNEPDTALCAYGKNAIEMFIEHRESSTLPLELQSFIISMLEKEDISAEQIDTEVSQYIADTQLKLAKRSGSPSIVQYVKHSIDLRNIRTALRNQEDIEKSLIKGGTILPSALTGGRERVLVAIDKSKLSYALSDAIEQAGEAPIALERACADIIAEDVSHMWNIPMSIEPVFAFAAIALSDIALLRTILIGKNNGMTPQEIKKIVPPFIPAKLYLS